MEKAPSINESEIKFRFSETRLNPFSLATWLFTAKKPFCKYKSGFDNQTAP